MPARIQPNRPYYPRYYLPRGAAQSRGAAQPRGGGRGALAPGGIDTTPTGSVAGDLVKAINATIQQHRQNAAANQILNTQTPPRAGALGPVVDPATGQVTGNITPTVGTPPQTGGMGELQMRQQMQQQDLADQLQRAKIGAQLALAGQRSARGGGAQGGQGGQGVGNANRWKQYLGGAQGGAQTTTAGGGKAGKPAAYEPFQYDASTDPRADKFSYIQSDFDSQFGKGMYSKVVPNLANAQPDEKGNYVIPGKDGNPLLTLPPNDANYWLNRFNAGRIAAGQEPVGPPAPGANPNAGQPAGTQVNPFKPSNNLGLRALPYNTYVIDPNTGQTVQKLPAPKPQASTDVTGNAPNLADLSQPGLQPNTPVSVGQFGGGNQGGPQLAGMVAPNAPASFDLGQLPTGGVARDTDLADAIRQAGVGNQLRGIA